MEDAASHVSTGVGVVVSGSVAFEDGGAWRGNGRCPGVFRGGGERTDRQEGGGDDGDGGGGNEVEAVVFLTNYY